MSSSTTAAPQPQTIRLHPAQQEFLSSTALYRGFVGGIGSGKTWCGSYDLLKRSKAERLYVVIAPTFTMLSDATFRVFLQLAEELGIVDESGVKRSAPPSIKLRNGAEVLFRSADDPDRLRGPNVSGIWLDEASLMRQEVFSIAIGRLRQAGEQGWLSATFTPKGKKHWTYQTFASGLPDTSITYAKTQDNPFLPVGFYGKLRPHYTSTLAGQELHGEFIDASGILFARDWFAIVDSAPPLVAVLRCWDLAATPKDENKASHDPDFAAGVKVGRAKDGTIYILDVRRTRSSPKGVEALVRRTAEEDGRHVHIWCEQEPGSSGKAQIDHYLRDVLPGFAFFGARSTGSKADRAMPLAAQAEGGAVRLVRCPWNGDFLDECETFPWGSHDDQVDAASLALAKLSRMPVVVPQPPAAFDQGKSDCYAADFSPRHRRVGATGLDSDYGFLAGGPGGYFQPGAMEEALAWPRYYTVAE